MLHIECLSGELGGKHPFEKWRKRREPESKLVRKVADNCQEWNLLLAMSVNLEFS